jgi:hypothetical protein
MLYKCTRVKYPRSSYVVMILVSVFPPCGKIRLIRCESPDQSTS